MQFRFKKELYEKMALFTAAYKFTDKAFIHIDMDNDDYIVDIEMKHEETEIRPEQFQNEILAAMVRRNINSRTKTVRELLLARAFASTVISETTDDESIEYTTDDINDITTDWFEKYE